MRRKQWLDNQIGQRFGSLVVLRAHVADSGETHALVKCDCGTETTVVPQNLRTGATRSCGCRRILVSRQKATRHGFTKHPEYNIWQQMIYRCEKVAHQNYSNYGGRGIKVCGRWQNFESFLADMGPRPSPEHSIDRYPNNDGNYEPGNCRWATIDEQQNNTRSNRVISFRGEDLTIAQWARRIGINPRTLAQRLDVGTPLEIAFSSTRFPGAKNYKTMLIEHSGHQMTVGDCARELGISSSGLYYRLKKAKATKGSPP